MTPAIEAVQAASIFDFMRRCAQDRIDRPRRIEGHTPRASRRLIAGYGRALWARGLPLTSKSTLGHAASRTARPLQFSAPPLTGRVRKSGPPLAASGGRRPRSLTPYGLPRRRNASDEKEFIMTRIFNPYTALDNIDAIRNKVLIRRDACRTEFARTLHANLVEKLDAMRADVAK